LHAKSNSPGLSIAAVSSLLLLDVRIPWFSFLLLQRHRAQCYYGLPPGRYGLTYLPSRFTPMLRFGSGRSHYRETSLSPAPLLSTEESFTSPHLKFAVPLFPVIPKIIISFAPVKDYFFLRQPFLSSLDSSYQSGPEFWVQMSSGAPYRPPPLRALSDAWGPLPW